jgi:hypothetical protein
LTTGVFYLAISGWLIGVGVDDKHAKAPYVGWIGGILFILLGIGYVWKILRCVSLTSSQLRVPRFKLGFRSDVIPVEDIGGLGLLWKGVPGGRTRWRPYVWRRDGSTILLSFQVFQRTTDQAALAASSPGKLVGQLYQRICTIQGPNGSLETMQLQKQQKTLFWSPDGTMGPDEKAQPFGVH